MTRNFAAGRLLIAIVLTHLLACSDSATEPDVSELADAAGLDLRVEDSSTDRSVPEVGDADLIQPDIETDGLQDVSVEDADQTALDTLSDAEIEEICEGPPTCRDSQSWRYCVDGVVYVAPCPDLTVCAPSTGTCEEEVCTADDNLCLDETRLQTCTDNGALLDETDCSPSLCADGACTGECVDGESRCLSETVQEVCVDGEWVEEPCTGDGSACQAGQCRSLCQQSALGTSYYGCVFWAVDLDNIVDVDDEGPGAEGVAVAVSNPSDFDALVDIDSAEGVLVEEVELAPGEVRTFQLPRRDQVGTRMAADAFRISSTVPVMAYQFNPLNREGTSSTDASLLLPEGSLASTYRTLNYPAQGYNQRGFLTVVGTGTVPTEVSVTVTGDTIAGVDYRGEANPLEARRLRALRAGQTITRTLQPFEVLQIESASQADLSGSYVRSERAVAVFSGNRCANVPTGVPRCDHLEHQMLPMGTWGQSFVATPTPQRDDELTYFRIIAEEDWTRIDTEPDLPGTPVILSRGEVFDFEVEEPVSVTSSSPAMLAQFMASSEARAGGLGDPAMTIIPPTHQFRSQYLFLVPEGYSSDTLTIIRPVGIDVYAGDTPIDIDFVEAGTGGYEVGYFDLVDGVHEVTSISPFGILVSGYDDDVSYAYPGGLELEKRTIPATGDTTGLCVDSGAIGAVCDTAELGQCSVGFTRCEPRTACVQLTESRTEVCNELDDNCDGEVDEGGVCSFGPQIRGAVPVGPRLEVVEGDVINFQVDVGNTGALDVEVMWFMDSVDGGLVPVQYGESMTWSVLAMEAGVHEVIVRATDGLKTAEYTWLVHVHDASTNAAALWGRTVDQDGNPLPQAPLETSGSANVQTTSDFRGLYAFVLDPGEYNIVLDGYPVRPEQFPPGDLTLVENVVHETVDLREDLVIPIGLVSGRVTDWNAQPVDGAHIHYSYRGDLPCQYCYDNYWTVVELDDDGIPTDASGTYSLPLYLGAYQATVWPPYDDPTFDGVINLVEQVDVTASTVHDFRFPGFIEVNAVAYDMRNQPEDGLICHDREGDAPQVRCDVPNAILVFSSDAGEVREVTDETGKASVRLPIGNWSIVLDSVSTRPPHIGVGRVPVGGLSISEETTGPIDIEVELPNVNITGTVVGAEDIPVGVSDVLMSFQGTCMMCTSSAHSGDDGLYEIDVLESDYRMRLYPPGSSEWASYITPIYAEDPIEFEGLDIVDYDFQFPDPVYIVDGFLADPFGNPVGETILGIYDWDGSDMRTMTGEDGSFRFKVVPGTYYIFIDTHARGVPYQPTGVPYRFPSGLVNIWWSDGPMTEDVHFPAEDKLIVPLSRIRGTVRDEDGGEGVPDVELGFRQTDVACQQCRNQLTTGNADGHVGEYEVVVYRGHPSDDRSSFSANYSVEVSPPDGLPAGSISSTPFTAVEETLDINLGALE